MRHRNSLWWLSTAPLHNGQRFAVRITSPAHRMHSAAWPQGSSTESRGAQRQMAQEDASDEDEDGGGGALAGVGRIGAGGVGTLRSRTGGGRMRTLVCGGVLVGLRLSSPSLRHVSYWAGTSCKHASAKAASAASAAPVTR